LGTTRFSIFQAIAEGRMRGGCARPDIVLAVARLFLIVPFLIEISLLGRFKVEPSFLGEGVRGGVEIGDLVGEWGLVARVGRVR
jgi:hypothetical protein